VCAHLSVTMSSTAPSVEVWLNVRAARPSSSSHTNLRWGGGGGRGGVRGAWWGLSQTGEAPHSCPSSTHAKKYAATHSSGLWLAHASAPSVSTMRA
jgi:hypothetical protein